MQLPKVVMSWLAAILAVLTTVIAVAQGLLAATPTPPSLIVKVLAILTAIATVIRGLQRDFPGSSDPVVAAGAQAGAVAGAQAAQKVVASQ